MIGRIFKWIFGAALSVVTALVIALSMLAGGRLFVGMFIGPSALTGEAMAIALEYLRIKGITIQTWSPFQGGFFKGPFIGDRQKYPALNEKLDELAAFYETTPTAIAAAWILRHPAKMQLISGSVSSGRLREIAAGAGIELSREDWYALYRAAGFCLP